MKLHKCGKWFVTLRHGTFYLIFEFRRDFWGWFYFDTLPARPQMTRLRLLWLLLEWGDLAKNPLDRGAVKQ